MLVFWLVDRTKIQESYGLSVNILIDREIELGSPMPNNEGSVCFLVNI